MQAHEFIRKWQPGGPAHDLTERAGAQPHFIDLCRMLGVPEPADPESYCFERGVTKTGSAGTRTDGFADVWLKGHFALGEWRGPGPDNGATTRGERPGQLSGRFKEGQIRD